MFLAQGGLSFLVWIGYGIIQSRRSQAIRTWVLSIPRARLGLFAALLMVVGLLALFGIIVLVYKADGFTETAMKPWGWAVVTVVGLAYVHVQTLAMAMLVILAGQHAVTQGTREPSQPIDPQEKP